MYVVLVVLLLPLQEKAVDLRLAASREGDARLSLVNRFIEGIRTIKAYAWETPVLRRIRDQRAKEVKQTRLFYLMMGFGEGLVCNPGILFWVPVIMVKASNGEYL